MRTILWLSVVIGILLRAQLGPAQQTSAGAEQRIYRALDEISELTATDTPLHDVAALLEKRHGIPIRLDVNALTDVGITTDMPVMLHVEGVTLRSVLRLMLRPMDLDFMVDNEALVITIPEVAELNLRQVAYPVRNLVRFRDDARATVDEFDTLTELITAIVEPNTWEAVGGLASIHGYDGTLVIAHTGECHALIRMLLERLRELQSNSDSSIAEGTEPLRVTRHQDADSRLEAALKRPCDFAFDKMQLDNALAVLSRRFEVPIQIDAKALGDLDIPVYVPTSLAARQIKLRSALHHLLTPLELTYMIEDETILVTTPGSSRAILTSWSIRQRTCCPRTPMPTLSKSPHWPTT